MAKKSIERARYCEYCGKALTSANPRAKYCTVDAKGKKTSACKQAAHRLAQGIEATPHPPPVTVTIPSPIPAQNDMDREALYQIALNQKEQIEQQGRLIRMLETAIEGLKHGGAVPAGMGAKRALPPPNEDELPGITVRDATTPGDSTANFLAMMDWMQDIGKDAKQ